jgi:hypothetical protein
MPVKKTSAKIFLKTTTLLVTLWLLTSENALDTVSTSTGEKKVDVLSNALKANNIWFAALLALPLASTLTVLAVLLKPLTVLMVVTVCSVLINMEINVWNEKNVPVLMVIKSTNPEINYDKIATNASVSVVTFTVLKTNAMVSVLSKTLSSELLMDLNLISMVNVPTLC